MSVDYIIELEKKGIDAKPLATQVAGNHGDLANKTRVLDIGNGCILKPVQTAPRGPREVSFYKKVFNHDTEDEDLSTLCHFLPQFYGVIQIDKASYMKLENITTKMSQSSVMDVKIGAITWDPDAPSSKIEQEKQKFPPAQKLGFRFAGFMIYNHESALTDYYDKHYCYNLTEETLMEKGFIKFFHPVDKNQHIIRKIFWKLKAMEKWFICQKLFTFYSSSLLLVYDSNPSLQQVKSDISADVRMIDFAHVFPADDIDRNYLHGLQTVIHYMELLLQ